ncbi:MAG: hypothetical protein ABFD12_05845 [Syntrophorhabdus sp.]
MKRILISVVAAFLLTGCATIYTKPGTTEADFEKDRQICEQATREDLIIKKLPET